MPSHVRKNIVVHAGSNSWRATLTVSIPTFSDLAHQAHRVSIVAAFCSHDNYLSCCEYMIGNQILRKTWLLSSECWTGPCNYRPRELAEKKGFEPLVPR